MFERSRDWTTLLPLRKNFSALHLQICGHLKQYDFDFTRYRANRETIFKKLGLYFDDSLQEFSFRPPKTFKPKKQTTWNTTHLHGNACSSGKLNYEKLSAVFYDMKVMNAEVFAEGLEKCRLLTTLLGQNVENLDDYGCPKVQDLFKTDSSWICAS